MCCYGHVIQYNIYIYPRFGQSGCLLELNQTGKAEEGSMKFVVCIGGFGGRCTRAHFTRDAVQSWGKHRRLTSLQLADVSFVMEDKGNNVGSINQYKMSTNKTMPKDDKTNTMPKDDKTNMNCDLTETTNDDDDRVIE